MPVALALPRLMASKEVRRPTPKGRDDAECGGNGTQGTSVDAVEADGVLQGSFHERRPYVVQILFDLLAHMDGKPVEFTIRALQDAAEQLQEYKAQNDEETDVAERLVGAGSSLHDTIAAGLLGDDVAERAGLLPPTRPRAPRTGGSPRLALELLRNRGAPGLEAPARRCGGAV